MDSPKANPYSPPEVPDRICPSRTTFWTVLPIATMTISFFVSGFYTYEDVKEITLGFGGPLPVPLSQSNEDWLIALAPVFAMRMFGRVFQCLLVIVPVLWLVKKRGTRQDLSIARYGLAISTCLFIGIQLVLYVTTLLQV